MKIIQICQRFYYGGGQERHVYHISKELSKLGHTVEIVTSDIGESKTFRRNLKTNGLKVTVLPAEKLDEPANQVIFPSLLSYLIDQDFDVIHAHGALCHSSQTALIAAKFKKRPFVFTPHYHPWNVFGEEKTKLIRKYYERMITLPVIVNSSTTIAVSDYEKQLLPYKYNVIPNDKIKVIPNGVDIEFIQHSHPRRDVRKKFSIPENGKYVLVFGSTTDLRKGLDRAISAFALVSERIPDAHLIILGANTDKSDEIKKMIKNKNLNGKVTACGYVTDEEKVAFLRMAHVLVSPTIYEAFGIVLAEAMFAQVPVVATKCGGVPYVMHHGKHGYLVGSFNSTHAFAKYTIRLLEHEELRKKMGKAGHERVLEKFQWPEIAKKIEKLYSSFLNGK